MNKFFLRQNRHLLIYANGLDVFASLFQFKNRAEVHGSLLFACSNTWKLSELYAQIRYPGGRYLGVSVSDLNMGKHDQVYVCSLSVIYVLYVFVLRLCQARQ